MTPRRYIAVISIVFTMLAGATIATNYLVDPYLVFGTPRIKGFNKTKVEISNYVRTSKVYQPTFARWDTLIVGNSRVEMGLNPDHACFEKTGATVYNLGIPGAGVGQQLAYAANVIYRQPIKRVFLSIDFVDFLVREEDRSPTTFHDAAATSNLPLLMNGAANPAYRWRVVEDRYKALFSLGALASSARTIMGQSAAGPDRTESGFNPAQDFARATEIEGAGALFAQKLASLETRYQAPWSLRYSDGSLTQDFERLSAFVTIAASRDIEVIVFTNPFHTQFWTLLENKGLSGLHAEWIDLVVTQLSSSQQSALWDFSGESVFIREEVPPLGQRSGPLRWFWEPAHYRSELGDLMLDTMLQGTCQSRPRFGRRLL